MKKTLLLCALLALLALPAAAGQTFNVTNNIAASTTVTAWPTNALTTNLVVTTTTYTTNGSTITTNTYGYYMGKSTGKYVGVQNQRSALLAVQCVPLVTNATTFSLTLVRSSADAPPTVSATQNDWDTVHQATFTFLTQNTTSAVCYQTNLADTFVGDANWLGVYSMTPGTGSGVTNLTISINGKILPIRYP